MSGAAEADVAGAVLVFPIAEFRRVAEAAVRGTALRSPRAGHDAVGRAGAGGAGAAFLEVADTVLGAADRGRRQESVPSQSSPLEVPTQAVVAGWNPFAGQAPDEPVQLSATSH